MKRSSVRSSLAVMAIVSMALWSAAPAAADVPAATLVGPVAENAPPGDPSHDYIYFTPVEDLSRFVDFRRASTERGLTIAEFEPTSIA